MESILFSILRARFGEPEVAVDSQMEIFWWMRHDDRRRCKLYRRPATADRVATLSAALAPVYGEFAGGFLCHEALKVAVSSDPAVWGLYTLKQLQCLPQLKAALGRDRSIEFFMDSANVWYYGVKGGDLYCYDRETDELYGMGPLRIGINKLLDEWLDVKASNERSAL